MTGRSGRSRSRHASYKRHRTRLWLEDPRCHHCGVGTVLVTVLRGRPPDDMATLDHVLGREEREGDGPLTHSAHRLSTRGTVLACYFCNNDRAVGQRPRLRGWPADRSERPELSDEAARLLDLLFWARREAQYEGMSFARHGLRRLGVHVEGVHGGESIAYAVLRRPRPIRAFPDGEGGVLYAWHRPRPCAGP